MQELVERHVHIVKDMAHTAVLLILIHTGFASECIDVRIFVGQLGGDVV